MIEDTVDKIFDTYDHSGDGQLSQEDAKAFIKDSLNVLMLKAKAESDGQDDIDLDLEDAKSTLEEDHWRLFTLFDPEYSKKQPDVHDDEYAGKITKGDMKLFLAFLLGDDEQPIQSN